MLKHFHGVLLGTAMALSATAATAHETANGLSVNGLSVNGREARGLVAAASRPATLRLQDGAAVRLR